MHNNNAKHFVLQLGSLITLFLSLGFLLSLLFGYIHLQFTDPADTAWEIESAASNIRIGFAMVVVFFPAYIILTRVVNKLRRKEKQTSYVGFTKWLIYFSLLLAGLVLLGDLVAVIMSFLEGDITIRFILKALAVLVVIGSAFLYYLLDANGYWLKRERYSILYGLIVFTLIVIALIASMTFIDSPSEVRASRIDQNQVYDLQSIQWRIQDYVALNNRLPENLEALEGEEQLPQATAERSAYRYETTAEGFVLCATFSKDALPHDNSFAMPFDKEAIIRNPDNWQYEAGETCFERTVTIPNSTE